MSLNSALSWEQRKLEEVITRIGTGLNPRDNFTLNSGGENYYVTIKNFVHGHLFLDDNCDKVDDEALKRIQERSDLCVNDILFTSIGRIGDCYLIKKQPTNWNINESVFTLRPNLMLVEPEYIYHTIHSDIVLNQIINGITGSTFKSIKIGDLKKVNIPVPSKAEQKQIAAFISIIDNLITLHQRKWKRINFAVHTDQTITWEQRKAKEICSIGTGKSNTQDQVDDGKYPFYIRSDVPVRSNKYLYDCEAVITIGDGNIGKVFHYVNGKFDLHQRCYKMTDFKDIWGKYFFYYFSTKFYDRAMKMTAKATVDSVRLEMISEMDIKKPPQISEQKQITEFFANLDNLITLHQCEFQIVSKRRKARLRRRAFEFTVIFALIVL